MIGGGDDDIAKTEKQEHACDDDVSELDRRVDAIAAALALQGGNDEVADDDDDLDAYIEPSIKAAASPPSAKTVARLNADANRLTRIASERGGAAADRPPAQTSTTAPPPLPEKYDAQSDHPCVFAKQRFVLLSYAGPHSKRPYSEQWALRVWCTAQSYEQALKRVEMIRATNPQARNWDIHIQRTGGWALFPPPVDPARSRYAETELQEIMDDYYAAERAAREYEIQRRQEASQKRSSTTMTQPTTTTTQSAASHGGDDNVTRAIEQLRCRFETTQREALTKKHRATSSDGADVSAAVEAELELLMRRVRFTLDTNAKGELVVRRTMAPEDGEQQQDTTLAAPLDAERESYIRLAADDPANIVSSMQTLSAEARRAARD